MHGDYRIDNTILDTDDPCHVRAKVVGDLHPGNPLSDAALMCVATPLDLIIACAGSVDFAAAASSRRAGRRYSLVSGQPPYWEFYMALAYFKLAIIAQPKRQLPPTHVEQAEGKDAAAESVLTALLRR